MKWANTQPLAETYKYTNVCFLKFVKIHGVQNCGWLSFNTHKRIFFSPTDFCIIFKMQMISIRAKWLQCNISNMIKWILINMIITTKRKEDTEKSPTIVRTVRFYNVIVSYLLYLKWRIERSPLTFFLRNTLNSSTTGVVIWRSKFELQTRIDINRYNLMQRLCSTHHFKRS